MLYRGCLKKGPTPTSATHPIQSWEGNLSHWVCSSLFCECLQTLAYCCNKQLKTTEGQRDRKRARGATSHTRGLTASPWKKKTKPHHQVHHLPTEHSFPYISSIFWYISFENKSTHPIPVKQNDDHRRTPHASILKLLWNKPLNDNSNFFCTALLHSTSEMPASCL